MTTAVIINYLWCDEFYWYYEKSKAPDKLSSSSTNTDLDPSWTHWRETCQCLHLLITYLLNFDFPVLQCSQVFNNTFFESLKNKISRQLIILIDYSFMLVLIIVIVRPCKSCVTNSLSKIISNFWPFLASSWIFGI